MSVTSWFRGSVESTQVRTTVLEDNTMACSPTGGTRGDLAAMISSSLVLVVS